MQSNEQTRPLVQGSTRVDVNRSIPRRIDEMARTNGKGQTTKNKRLHRTTVSVRIVDGKG
ncbi:hypothetical protein BLOT_012644 [Blomia tropicalis]|nr:hypothetical protein BLOT_012644 [Blomia tropicalis]